MASNRGEIAYVRVGALDIAEPIANPSHREPPSREFDEESESLVENVKESGINTGIVYTHQRTKTIPKSVALEVFTKNGVSKRNNFDSVRGWLSSSRHAIYERFKATRVYSRKTWWDTFHNAITHMNPFSAIARLATTPQWIMEVKCNFTNGDAEIEDITTLEFPSKKAAEKYLQIWTEQMDLEEHGMEYTVEIYQEHDGPLMSPERVMETMNRHNHFNSPEQDIH